MSLLNELPKQIVSHRDGPRKKIDVMKVTRKQTCCFLNKKETKHVSF